MLRRMLSRLGWTVAFVLVVAAGLLLNRVVLQPAPYQASVPVQDAAGLYSGSDVMIAGARAGSVSSITLRGGASLVTFSVDPEHAPLHLDATIAIRPKSLLGERYVALDPGQAAGTLPSGATLPATSVIESTNLEDVINTFDQPTRDKLQTLIVELGAGTAGRGPELNAGLAAGREDLSSLRGIADTLASRDAQLRDVIANLASVTQELARSDRSQQLGQLIQNLETLVHNLARQEAQLQQALTEANAALSRTDAALQGTGGDLASIVGQLPATVHLADLIMADLGPDSSALLPHLAQLNAAIAEGPSVFGGTDANGFATRITPVVGCGTVSACRALSLGGTPVITTPSGSAPPGSAGPAAASSSPVQAATALPAALDGDVGLNAIADLLLGRPGR